MRVEMNSYLYDKNFVLFILIMKCFIFYFFVWIIYMLWEWIKFFASILEVHSLWGQ